MVNECDDNKIKFEDTNIKYEDITIKSEDIAIKSEDISIKSEDIVIKSEDILIKPEEIAIKSENNYIKSEDIYIKSEDKDADEVKAQDCEVQEKEDMDHVLSFSQRKFDENLLFKNRFPCNVCPKSYSLKNNLNEHMRTHTGDKSFTCNICDKIYSQKSESNYHKKSSLEFQDKRFLNKGFREGWLLLPKQSQNFQFQVF